MFFHIDESGNTGNNLFDENQPILSYGLLSSRTNVDILGTKLHRRILNKIGDDCLHANVLGVEKLTGSWVLLSKINRPAWLVPGFNRIGYWHPHQPGYVQQHPLIPQKILTWLI
ncbi:MAG: hypothetical protein MI976_28080 [Pseudomonadales bacterium]|nr:hypothetical protein [Pseudomonadales bacterium]